MKTYKSYKTVRAAKIKNIVVLSESQTKLELEDSDAIIVDKSFMSRHSPYVGGYYILYRDGYQSYSPKDAFEGGYEEVK
jgi:hypothetical protein